MSGGGCERVNGRRPPADASQGLVMQQGEPGQGSNGGGGGDATSVRELVHEINNRLFVVRMGAATVAELLGDGAEEIRAKLDAMIEAAEQASEKVRELAAIAEGDRGGAS